MADYERIMYCDTVECCEMCPRYGDDCDGWQYFDESCFEDDCGVVRCKDCRWYDNRYGDVCHNPRYGDGHANYPPPYVDEDYWCKDGERKGGEDE